MAKKKDPSISFLNNLGYNVVKLPRAGIEPLDVVGVDQSAQWLGPIKDIVTTSATAPVPSPPHLSATVNGQKSDTLDAPIAINVLANALAAFGATTPSLTADFNRAKKMQFSYSNVTETNIAPTALGAFLGKSQLDPDNALVSRFFEDPKCKAYVITSVVKSDTISVTASDDKGGNVDVEVPSIAGAVGASVKVTASGSSSSSVTFTGPQPVTFGFQVLQLIFSNGKFSLGGSVASPDIAFSNDDDSSDTGASQAVIFADPDGDCRIDLADPETVS